MRPTTSVRADGWFPFVGSTPHAGSRPGVGTPVPGPKVPARGPGLAFPAAVGILRHAHAVPDDVHTLVSPGVAAGLDFLPGRPGGTP